MHLQTLDLCKHSHSLHCAATAQGAVNAWWLKTKSRSGPPRRDGPECGTISMSSCTAITRSQRVQIAPRSSYHHVDSTRPYDLQRAKKKMGGHTRTMLADCALMKPFLSIEEDLGVGHLFQLLHACMRIFVYIIVCIDACFRVCVCVCQCV